MLHPKIKFFIVISMVVSIIGLVISLSISITKTIEKNTERARSFYSVQGEIIDLRKWRAIYSYKVDNKLRFDSILGFPCDPNVDYFNKETIEKDLIGFTFPVFLSRNDSSFINPMVHPNDFRSYGMKMPDSLNYVYNKYLNCRIWE